MAYRLVYDVLADARLPVEWSPLVFLGFGLFWTAALLIAWRAKPPPRAERQQMWVAFGLGCLLVGVGAWMVLARTVPAYQEQRQCRAWMAAGDVEVVEGPIQDYDPAVRSGGRYKGGTDFRVGAARFRYVAADPSRGGFRGEFTDPAWRGRSLREGLPVRISHRDGRILRIEVPESEG